MDPTSPAAPPAAPSPPGERAALAEKLLRGILDRLGVTAEVASHEAGDEVRLRVRVTAGGEAVGLVGERPPLWEPIGHLLSRMVVRDPARRCTIRIGGFGDDAGVAVPAKAPARVPAEATLAVPAPEVLAPIDEELLRLGRLLGERALALGKVLAVGPLGPTELQALLLGVKDLPGMRARSDGEGGPRRLLLIPDRLAPVPEGQG